MSLKSALTPVGHWRQADPWKKSVAVWREEASPGLGDISYEECMDLAPDERRAVFNRVSAEAKARLMRTQLERFLEVRGDALTWEQRVVLQDALAVTSAGLYATPRESETEARARGVESRVRLLFTPAEAQQLLTLEGQKIVIEP